jgi:nicotinate-nucleotide adenylyltransferase
MAPPCILLLGGSFDPVHHGHVALARLFTERLHPQELRVVPAGQPWQKGRLHASDEDRLAMLKLAFDAAGLPYTLDRQELDREGPSYTIDTLRQVRGEVGPQASLVLLMGADQLQNLATWREWQALFGLAHIGVASRPGNALDAGQLPAAVAAEVTGRVADAQRVRGTPCGCVLVVPELDVDISATTIRTALAQGTPANGLLPDVVLDYIQQHHLYKN